MYNTYGYDIYDYDMYDYALRGGSSMPESLEMTTAFGMLGFIGLIYFLLLAYVVVNYVIRSIGLYRLAKANGVSAPGLAWVPYAMDYIFGKVSGDIKLGKRTLKNTPLWLVLIPIIGGGVIFVLAMIMVIAIVFMALSESMYGAAGAAISAFFVSYILLLVGAIAYSVFYYIVYGMTYYTVCSKYKDSGASVFSTLLALFVPLADAIILFKLGKAAMPEPEPAAQSPAQYIPYTPPAPSETNQNSGEDEISSFLPKE